MVERAVRRTTAGTPTGTPYDAGMKVERVSVETVRKDIGQWAVQAGEQPLDSHKVITRHGAERLVVVDMDWYRRARKALKDPTDL